MNLKEWIIPTKENDFSPHLLQKTAFLMMGGLVVLSFVAVNAQTLIWLSSDWLVGTVLPAVVIDETNKERTLAEEAPLSRNAKLDQAAQLKAEDMAKNAYFSHYSPAGISPWYWFDKVAYSYAHAGENLAVHFSDSKAVVDAWMNSPAHKANIMNGRYLEIGVGTAEGEYQGFKTVFIVQLFGTPASMIQPLSTTASATEELEKVALAPTPVLSTPEVLGETSDIPIFEEDIEETNTTTNVESAPPLPANDSFISTSSDLVPISNTVFKPVPSTTRTLGFDALATKPNSVLRIIYLSLGLVIITLLFTSLFLAVRESKPWQVLYGVALLVIMTALFYVHHLYIANVVVNV